MILSIFFYLADVLELLLEVVAPDLPDPVLLGPDVVVRLESLHVDHDSANTQTSGSVGLISEIMQNNHSGAGRGWSWMNDKIC